jgi:hypothetical protein
MAHFIGGACGNRGEATRLGTSGSGMHCYADGWDIGCKVDAYVNSDGKDEICVTLTGGSNHKFINKSIGVFTRKDLDK